MKQVENNHIILEETLYFLVAAVTIVPLFRLVKLGPILGFLIAGITIGPWGLGLINELQAILNFAEFGVILLLFLIGLEITPARLSLLKRKVFFYGPIQVFASAALLHIPLYFFNLPFHTTLLISLTLSLSSTALIISLLEETKTITQSHGQVSLGILLFQDLMVIPIILAIPFLSTDSLSVSLSLTQVLFFIGSLLTLTLSGIYLIRPILTYLSKTQGHEIFISSCLLVVLGTSFLMHKIGLTMSLGALISGMFLAKSSLKQEIEKSLTPFKSLLMGLFFMGIGMELNLSIIATTPLTIFLLTTGLLLIKGTVLAIIGKLGSLDYDKLIKLSIMMGGGGEFAFVIFTTALKGEVLAANIYNILLTVVTISMIFSAIFLNISNYILKPKNSLIQAPLSIVPDLTEEKTEDKKAA